MSRHHAFRSDRFTMGAHCLNCAGMSSEQIDPSLYVKCLGGVVEGAARLPLVGAR